MKPPAGPVGIISNPASGHNRDQFAGIRAIIDRYPAIHHRITASAADIAPALREFAALKVAVLAINGGDGTNSAILGELLESQVFHTPPLIALLPGGTANMNAGDIGVRGTLPKAVTRFCRWSEGERLLTGKVAQRALMRVVIDDLQPARHGMFLGGGAVIHGTEYAHKEIHSRGLRDDFSLALGTIRTVWGVLRDDPRFNRHVAITLKLDDRAPVQRDTLILAVSTLQRLAFGMRPFWSNEPGDVRLTLMEQGCTRFARTFFSIVRGRPSAHAVPNNGYHSHNADRMRLSMAGTVNLDGELLEVASSVAISATATLEIFTPVSAYPPVKGPDPAADATLAALLAQLEARHFGAICCTLVYGSCLRSGDIYDGLLDLYLICDDYRSAYRSGRLAAANWLLPPNVFYAEQKPVDASTGGKTLRCKVTVISLRDFQRGCSTAWFESYIWGRFAQPTSILRARNENVRAQVEGALTNAARTLLRKAVPALPPEGSLAGLWEQALALSYSTELRTERSGRAQELVQSAFGFYTALSGGLCGQLGFTLELIQKDGEWHYRSAMVNRKRLTASIAWAFRRAQGKLFSILRLVKALFTFAGGLDYIAWKLERHSGVAIQIPDKVRRAPLIHLWGFFWGLYRRGIFK